MNKLINGFIALAVLDILSLLIGVLSQLTIIASFRIVFGSVFVLFLPGFVLTFIFFRKTKPINSKTEEKGAIDWIERIALSFALSIAVVPLAVFYLNLIGVKINLLNSFLTILGIIIICLTVLYWQKRRRMRHGTQRWN